MSWIIHMDQSYRHPYCRRPYETIFDSEQNFFGKCCHQHAVSSSPTSPETSKLNLTLLADKFVGKIVEKLSILDLTRRDHCKQKNQDGKESLSLKNNKRKICKDDDDDDEAFWPFIKLIIFFILTILFYYLMFSIDQRHRHLSSLQNGSMFNGHAYHTNGTNYFFWNRSMIEKTTNNKSNSIAIGNYLRLPIANQLRSSIDNQSSSSTTDDKMMDDKQFIQYLFNNIQMWID